MNRKNKITSILMVFCLLCVFTVGCSKKSENTSNQNTKKDNSEYLVTLVLDKGGVNDESFNQLAWEGAKKASIE